MQAQKKTVLVVGAGASGMAAAIAAARAGASVTLLEKEEKPGRKLLATGNGRCNLTNVGDYEKAYFGGEPAFAKKVREFLSESEVMAFFRGLGLAMTEENGRVYPYSGQAESVRYVLLRELSALRVRVKCGEEVLFASKEGDGFHVRTRTWDYVADALVLACGTSASLTKKQLPANGFLLAEGFGHRLAPLVPALVPLRVAEAGKLAFFGVRLRGSVLVCAEGESLAEDTGQLQLTENGISGIPVFNVSGRAARAMGQGKRVRACLDFLPDIPKEETVAYLRGISGGRPVWETLKGLFPDRLVRSFQKSFSDKEPSLEELAGRIRRLELTVTGTAGEGYAQVLSGGVLTGEVSSRTLASKLVPGLFLTGEMLDIDGLCGGFNLQFAWATGILAGREAGTR